MLKFSVLLPVYHKETAANFNQCLESLSIQTLFPSEVVIVKDGCLTPELENVLELWSTKLPLKIIGYEFTQGLAYALNFGLRACSYELVARMDTDDISLPRRFEQQIQYLEQNPDIAVVSGYISEFREQPGDMVSIRKVPVDNADIRSRLKVRNAFNHMAVVLRKSAVFAVGGYQNVDYFEDYDLWIRLAQTNQQFANLPAIVVYVRIGNNMLDRRRGFGYAKKEFAFIALQRKRGFISKGVFVLLLCRLPLRLLPLPVFAGVYKLLRKL
jgi:glycosyltransferase involved in cell wall biosynthesis